jgi:hypothetical protein
VGLTGAAGARIGGALFGAGFGGGGSLVGVCAAAAQNHPSVASTKAMEPMFFLRFLFELCKAVSRRLTTMIGASQCSTNADHHIPCNVLMYAEPYIAQFITE